MSKPQYIFIHHTAVSYTVNPDQWESTNAYHRDERKFPVSSLGFYVGYNYEIAANGTIRKARNEGEETAAVIGFNFDSVSICLDGNFDMEMPTQKQITAMTSLLKEVMLRHSIPLEHIMPHRLSYDLLSESRQKSCFGSLLSDTWARDLVTPKSNRHTFYLPLKKGDTGSEVLALQRCLNSMGFNCRENGIYDSTLVAEVFEFQKKYAINDVWSFISVWTYMGTRVGTYTIPALNKIFA